MIARRYIKAYIMAGIVLISILISQQGKAVPAWGPLEQQQIIIIDPGHGGEDGGAVSVHGYNESEINLQLALRLEQLFAFCGYKTVMTRSSEIIDYPDNLSTIRSRKQWDQNRRVDIINSQENTLLLSIHQNYYPSTQPFGAQVLYNGHPESQPLAQLIQSRLISNLQPTNKRDAVKASEDIYLMRKADCTAILLECGFLSNPNEEQALLDSIYQTKLSVVIVSSVSSYCSGVTYES